jgi:hypothetical protein
MHELVQYALEVVAIPAAVGAVVASAAFLSRVRRRPALAEGCIASGLALAFLGSFLTDPGWKPLARQVVALDGDDGVFERWHRLALVAAVLVAAGLILSVRRAEESRPSAMLRSFFAALAASVLCGWLVVFPQSSLWLQALQGALVFAAIVGWIFAGPASAWVAWVVFGTLAALSKESGFAYLAAMCGAVSLAAFLIGVLGALGGRRAERAPIRAGGALLLVPGTLAALVARCGMAYDSSGIPAWSWIVAALLPYATLLFDRKAKRALAPAAKTFWIWLGAALVAAAVVAWNTVPKGGAPSDGGADDDLSEMYGSAALDAAPTAARQAVAIPDGSNMISNAPFVLSASPFPSVKRTPTRREVPLPRLAACDSSMRTRTSASVRTCPRIESSSEVPQTGNAFTS